MKFSMPLFSFYNEENRPFRFNDSICSISRFSMRGHAPLSFFFSRSDRMYMQDSHWALTLNSPIINNSNYKSHLGNSEIIIFAFKVFCKASLFTKYRVSADSHLKHIRINEPMMYYSELQNHKNNNDIIIQTSRRDWMNKIDFEKVDIVYPKLIEMWNISNRTRNAIDFMMNAFRSQNWRDSFLFHMIAIESFFSSSGRKGMTEKVAKRASAFLNHEQHCSEDDIRNLYDLRSEIVHGKIPFMGAGSWDKNIIKSAHAELIATKALIKMIDTDIYTMYSHDGKTQSFLSHLYEK